MAINDLWRGYLIDHPKEAYFGFQNQWQTPNMKKYYQNQFGNIQDQYMGQLGQRIYQGGAPNLEFTDFLKQFNWGQQFNQQTPQQRGMDSSQFNPWTRWML